MTATSSSSSASPERAVSAAELPGYEPGTWVIDPVHSEIAFAVRHLGVANVRGRFDEFEGEIVLAENPLESSVTATIKIASVSTAHEQRDNHIRSADFLHAEEFPEMTFRSTGVRPGGAEGFLLDGELSVRGVTRPVTLDLELHGFGKGYEGRSVVGFTATTRIGRKDFGVTGGAVGATLGDTIKITLDVEASRG
ncbi:YceI family protein [Streptomyces sp. TLI_146]|uniref:YceI family protein n=1 Tax=Streptomyces sp. TLI_146 TaxID=1938858 RepID=UPI000C70E02A|nr:YceI family protein [Streptomyces sp. TLI_146]PKV86499.1 polyisoprenoid-binding protein YceI [Streptomyces sp. TLI_146]